jgi:rhombotail lipoprotein
VIEGDRNETRTMLDATVLDIRSRALLFSASGASRVEDTATAIDIERALREKSREGFAQATDDLIASLDRALAGFREQIKSGTVRGQGTPAISVAGASGAAGGGVGAGGLGAIDLAAVVLLLAASALARRPRA